MYIVTPSSHRGTPVFNALRPGSFMYISDGKSLLQNELSEREVFSFLGQGENRREYSGAGGGMQIVLS